MLELLVPLIFITSIFSSILSLIAIILLRRPSRNYKENYLKLEKTDVILISGCDSGIGQELAKHFFKTLKCKIICGLLNSQHNTKGYQELIELGRSNGEQKSRLILAQLDLTSTGDISKLTDEIDKLKKDGCRLIAIINNAGTMTYGEFDWLTWDQIHNQVNVNLTGTMKLTRAVLPYIIENRGRIINVSSVNDNTVLPGLSIYSATKSALSTFSRGLGYELKKFGIHVTTIRLGDFARLTNIMSNHERNQSAMWNEMSSRKKTIYKDYFDQFNLHLLKNYGMTSPRNFKDSNLFSDFERALLDRRPPLIITCAPIQYRIFYFLIELMPIWLQHYLLDCLIKYGFGWKAPSLSDDQKDSRKHILEDAS